jgi:hypothetical protein
MQENAGTFRLLVRHFFGRFSDNEALSPQADPAANLGPILGLLGVPGAFLAILLQTVVLTGWSLITFRYFFVAFSMIAMAFIVVLKWDALFPDRRDYVILTPLPLRPSIVFLARVTALALFLAVFLAAINSLSVLMWPGVDRGGTLAVMGGHLVSCLAAGLFAALAAGAVQGFLITVLPAACFRRVSALLQVLLMSLLVVALFLTPLIGHSVGHLVKSGHPILYYFPVFWFVGLYEMIRPATNDPLLLELGRIGAQSLGLVAVVFLLTYLPAYRRSALKAVDMPAANPSGPGRLRNALDATLNRFVLTTPVQRAVFHFINQTIARSMKHRIFLAVYGGFGIAIAAGSLVSGESGLLKLPFALSFLLVSALRAAFNFPSELRANWAFQITENQATGDYMNATRKWVALHAIVPLFLLLAPVEFLKFSWPTAVFHLSLGLVSSLLLMEIMFAGFRKVAFTCSYFPGRTNLIGLGVIYLFGFTAYSRCLAALERFLDGMPFAILGLYAAMLTICVLVARWGNKEREGEGSLEYNDDGEPAVRSLGLASR